MSYYEEVKVQAIVGEWPNATAVEICASWQQDASDDEVNAALLSAVGKFTMAYAAKRGRPL